jgi:hypothetical protein
MSLSLLDRMRETASGHAEVRLDVAAPPDKVYDLVADVTRMGEYSPECCSCVWLDGSSAPAVGARFRGSNRFGLAKWSRVCEVIAAQVGREFAFRTVPSPAYRDSTTWRYTFEPSDAGTALTESYQITRLPWYMQMWEVLSGRPKKMPEAMRETLRRIKAAAEVSALSG